MGQQENVPICRIRPAHTPVRTIHHPKLRTWTLLQIASGKLFQSTPGQRNELRGVLHTNLFFLHEAPIETVAGRILPTNSLSPRSGQLVYEFTELIEQSPGAGVLASHGIEPYLHDFAAIVSIALEATCTVTPEEISRLIGQHRSTKIVYPPRSYIPRVFDSQIVVKDDEIKRFIGFVDALIALQRRSFLAAMRAIRNYVVGMHRLADDLELAYTLFVASIESLAQQFDAFQPEWDDYDESKRRKIDSALLHADETTACKVRNALLKIEHVSLTRRFREFSIAHVRGSYFRDETEGVTGPVNRADLVEALREAYRLRSQYIHNLKELPRPLAISAITGDTVRVEGRTLLTFQGIARLARHVILEFVDRQPKLQTEKYDYSGERYGIVRMPLAPQYWVGGAENITLKIGTKRLEGFLNQLSSYFSKDDDSSVTDLTPALSKAEALFSGANEAQRRPFLALYFLFNALMPDAQKMPNLQSIESKYESELTKPSIESMLLHLALRITPNWLLDDYKRVYDDYFRQRSFKTGLRLPRTFEAGISLELAEHYRVAGEVGSSRELIGRATESYPGHKPLRDLEREFSPQCRIRWFPIIFPEMSSLTD